MSNDETVLDFLLNYCNDNELARNAQTCRSILERAYKIRQSVFIEKDWGTVYERDVLVVGRKIRFYPTTYFSDIIPEGWEWSWETICFI